MPLFHDVHDGLILPPEAIVQIKAGAEAREHDQFGVRQEALYYNADGHVVCILDAPDEQAVRDHHHALGVSCGDVHSVTSIM